ncbi:MAG: hypothetical protein LUG54_08870 [Clostridiales bacterium]|nr:hypothetical protein [Clostridiales bacterium]
MEFFQALSNRSLLHEAAEAENDALRHQIRMDIFYDMGISAPDIMRAFRLILKNTAPARILPRTDVFNGAILKYNDPALVRYAVKQGYITRVNALAFYDEVTEAKQWEGEKEKISEEILLLLIHTANGMQAEKYKNGYVLR